MRYLRQGTAADVVIGPLLDDTDFKSAETVAFDAAGIDVNLIKGATKGDRTLRVDAGDGYWRHLEDGYHAVTLGTGDTDTVGALRVTFTATGVLPAWEECCVLPAQVYDSIVAGTDYLDANAAQVGGQTATAAAGVTFPASIGTSTLAAGAKMDLVDSPNSTALAAVATAIWNALVSGLTVVGSVGKRLVDYLDTTVSSRSTYAGGAVASVTDPVTLTGDYDAAKTVAQAGAAVDVTTIAGTDAMEQLAAALAAYDAATGTDVSDLVSSLLECSLAGYDTATAATGTRVADLLIVLRAVLGGDMTTTDNGDGTATVVYKSIAGTVNIIQYTVPNTGESAFAERTQA